MKKALKSLNLFHVPIKKLENRIFNDSLYLYPEYNTYTVYIKRKPASAGFVAGTGFEPVSAFGGYEPAYFFIISRLICSRPCPPFNCFSFIIASLLVSKGS